MLKVCGAVVLLAGSVWAADENFEIQEFKVDRSVKLPTASMAASEAWKDSRFGMFIHWGPISQMGQTLSHSRNSPSHRTGGKPYKVSRIEPEVYDVQYKTFNPVAFDPQEMIGMAKRAGVDYVVFTAKHHAGFSMFDSAVSEYDMMSTPYKKDITKMLAEACREQDIDFGLYYSPRDWYHPDCDSDNHHDRYIKFYKAQMGELLSNYGPIHEVWFDGMGPGEWGDTSRTIMGAIRKLHPDAMVNDRGGAGADFYTPEHSVSYFNRHENWEACHTTAGQWGFNPKGKAKPLAQLMEIMLYTWGGDGNMLLNIGPTGTGEVNPVERERFEQLAEWWSVHGETSIRGSRGGPYLPGPWGVATCKGNQVYLHIFRWPEAGGLRFPALDGLKLTGSRLLSGGTAEVKSDAKGIFVQVPKSSRQEIVTTVELSFDGPTLPVEPLHRVVPISAQASLSASQNQKLLKHLQDGDPSTNWEGSLKKSKGDLWVEARFDEPVELAAYNMGRGEDFNLKHQLELQIPDEEGDWKTITPERLRVRWEPIKFFDAPVKTDRIRLLISKTKTFKLAEFELYAPIR